MKQPSLAIAAAALCLAACGQSEPAQPVAFSASGEIIALGGGSGGPLNACIGCHGLRGEGDGNLSPRLAGFDRGYLHRQLDDYANGRRQHSRMSPVAARLKPVERELVAAYYAGLAIAPAPSPVLQRRHPLYDAGDAARGIPACASCHGSHGEGVGAANPPLALQPPDFLAGQLRAWQRGVRQNDPSHVMLTISRQLTEAEIRSVSAYAASLAGLDRQAGSAASPPARRGGPRSGVSAPLPHAAE